jgi:hypothetical protein
VDAWLASHDVDAPFTLVTICDTFNIDPDYLRLSGNDTQQLVVLPPVRRGAWCGDSRSSF